MRRRHALPCLIAAAFGAPTATFAQAPGKPLRLIVPYPPGGPLDIVARALAERVKDVLGVVVVENRPGAGGNLGADLATRSAPRLPPAPGRFSTTTTPSTSFTRSARARATMSSGPPGG